MLEKIAKLDAAVIRGVLVTAVPVIAILLNILFGIEEKVFSDRAGQLIESIMGLWAAAGLAYIAWARITKPNPPLSDSAVLKAEEMVSKGTLKIDVASLESATKSTLEPRA